jgi:hypothetical protein
METNYNTTMRSGDRPRMHGGIGATSGHSLVKVMTNNRMSMSVVTTKVPELTGNP